MEGGLGINELTFNPVSTGLSISDTARPPFIQRGSDRHYRLTCGAPPASLRVDLNVCQGSQRSRGPRHRPTEPGIAGWSLAGIIYRFS